MNTYLVTRHAGNTPASSHSGTLLYKTPEESVAFRVYDMLRPLAGMTIALWRPDGNLLQMKSGSRRESA
jgi:hypothetical protein